MTVSSNAHTTGRIDFSDLQGERSYCGARAYGQCRLATCYSAPSWPGALNGTSVTANALHPGVVRTSFGADGPATVQRMFVPFLRPFMKSPAPGAPTSIHLASRLNSWQVTARYFAKCKPQEMLRAQLRPAAAARLWQVSAGLVGLPIAADTLLRPPFAAKI